MGLLARTVEVLEGRRQDFIPALAQPVGQATAWTLRDAMLVALGLDRDAGPLAYFEYLELTAVLGAADLELAQANGLDRQAQRWANDRDRTFDEVLELVDGVAASSTVEGPPNPTLRPYCRTKLIRTCRVPYVPTVVLLLRWQQLGGGPIGEFLLEAGVTEQFNSFRIMEQIDPLVRDMQDYQPAAKDADAVHHWLFSRAGRSPEGRQQEPVAAPVKLLQREAETNPDLDLQEFVDRARQIQQEGEAESSDAA